MAEFDLEEARYTEARQRAFDEYVREQDADLERRQLTALYEQGAFLFDD